MNWLTGLLIAGALATGILLDQRRRREQGRLPRAEISRWEEEGGAVPVSANRTAAQTHPQSDIA